MTFDKNDTWKDPISTVFYLLLLTPNGKCKMALTNALFLINNQVVVLISDESRNELIKSPIKIITT